MWHIVTANRTFIEHQAHEVTARVRYLRRMGIAHTVVRVR